MSKRDVEWAVGALSKHGYLGAARWVVGLVDVYDCSNERQRLSNFAAIAIAEKLERDAAVKSDGMTASEWFELLVEANEIGDANLAVAATDGLRALGWDVKSADGNWPARDMPATRKLAPVMGRFAKEMAELGDDFVLSVNDAGSYTVGDLRAAVAEWEGLP